MSTPPRSFKIASRDHRPISADFYRARNPRLPTVVFVHGYKGYKDWGPWAILGKRLVQEGFGYLAFNFSLNGTTPEHPNEFVDLEAFAENTYSREVEEVHRVLDYLQQSLQVPMDRIVLMGHSRGGGIAVMAASARPVLAGLVTLGAVSDLDRFPKGSAMEAWEQTGTYQTFNGRTGQWMPHRYTFYQDFVTNREALDIQKAAKKLSLPTLIFHGDADEAVEKTHAQNLHSWIAGSTLEILPGANHTFGGTEPWPEEHLPKDLDLLAHRLLDWLERLTDNSLLLI